MSERSRAGQTSEQALHTEAGHPGSQSQLRLLPGGEPNHDWVLDERTRQLGRSGVAQARAVLRRARRPEPRKQALVRKAS